MDSRLEGDIDALILAAQDLEYINATSVKALPQYTSLLDKMRAEMERFTAYLQTTLGLAALSAITLGLTHSEELIQDNGIDFAGLDAQTIAPLLDYLAEGSPLYNRLQLITTATIDSVIKSIVDGVSQGFNPRKTAALIQDAFAGGLTDALRNVRTVQLWAYRDAARANYMATGGIVTAWVWWAELDADVCMSCVAQHGTIHPLEEQLNDHYNGRCAAIPYIPELAEPTQSGQEWFDGLSETQQRKLMGPSKLEAYKANSFEFSALSSQKDNEVYGTMRTEASLKELLER